VCPLKAAFGRDRGLGVRAGTEETSVMVYRVGVNKNGTVIMVRRQVAPNGIRAKGRGGSMMLCFRWSVSGSDSFVVDFAGSLGPIPRFYSCL
jgi:hypothetical protein